MYQSGKSAAGMYPKCFTLSPSPSSSINSNTFFARQPLPPPRMRGWRSDGARREYARNQLRQILARFERPHVKPKTIGQTVFAPEVLYFGVEPRSERRFVITERRDINLARRHTEQGGEVVGRALADGEDAAGAGSRSARSFPADRDGAQC